MIKKFDVWVEPWIPIVNEKGSRYDVSICTALKEAHNISAIRANIPADTFGIHRLLITILTDMFRPKTWADCMDIRNNKRFCCDSIDNYYNICLAEGASFDLFDKQRPFLQYAFPTGSSFETRSAAYLFDHLPTGNNVPHFIHNKEDDYTFTPARCTQALCSIPFYEKHKRGRLVTTGINGVPPIYFLYNGENLFDTLVTSMVPKSLYTAQEFGLPIWRDRDYFEKGVVIVPDFLHGLFSAPLKVQLLQSSNSLINKIKVIDNGVNYSNVVWSDPHVVYYEAKNKTRLSLKAREGRAAWRDLAIVIQPNSLKMLINHHKREINGGLLAYIKLTELKGTVFMAVNQFVEDVKIPFKLLKDDLKRESYSRAISTSDNLVSTCSYALRLSDVKNVPNPFAEMLSQSFSETFLAKVKEFFDNQLIELLADADTDTPDWELQINNFIKEELSGAIFIALNSALNAISDEDINTVILKNKLRKRVNIKAHIIFKKGGYIYEAKRKTK